MGYTIHYTLGLSISQWCVCVFECTCEYTLLDEGLQSREEGPLPAVYKPLINLAHLSHPCVSTDKSQKQACEQ